MKERELIELAEEKLGRPIAEMPKGKSSVKRESF